MARLDVVFMNGRHASVEAADVHSHDAKVCWDPFCPDWAHKILWLNRVEATTAVKPVKPTARQAAEKRLRHAWSELNRTEMEKVVPKAIEYGSGDLKLMGYAMKMLLNSPRARQRDWTEAESMEIAIAFYTLGKVARELSAFEMGNMPSEDQPHDIGVYQRMVQVIRKEGSWPPGFDEFLKEAE